MITKEARRIYDRAYRNANAKKVKAQRKAYREANLEKAKLWQKTYRDAHPEEVKAQRKAYNKANKEKMNAQNRASRKAKPEKTRDQNRKRRALKRTTRVERISEKIVYLRDGGICQHCKKRVDKKLKNRHPMSASLDHIVPLSKGGTHTYNNVQLAHLGCNVSKGNNLLPQGEQLRLC